MRLTTVILLITIMQVSASVSAQRVTFNENNTSLQELFKAIKKQTGYNIVVSSEQLKASKPISVNFNNTPLEEVLSKSMEGQNLSWTIKQKTIVISEKEPAFTDRLKNYFKAVDIKGRVLDEKGNPLPGAIIKIKGTSISVSADQEGNFTIKNVGQNAILQVSYIGYKIQESKVSDVKGFIYVNMELMDNKLSEVEIVSTGFQKLPKERATGSFELVDNQLFNRKTSTDILSRLDGVVNSFLPLKSLTFTRLVEPLEQLSIRGTSSFNAAKPMIVVDNFPYDGDSRNINPNDVENITILKDAAAASIWGSRASNGVIVITTKKGAFETPLKISLNSNVSLISRPDLYSDKAGVMSSSDYIDVEQFLFNKGYYDALSYFTPSNEFRRPKTQALEILQQQRTNLITPAQASAKLNVLRGIDSRNDFLKYIYRPAVNQQYAMNISGGEKRVNYFFSAGYDKNLNSLVTSSYDRISIRANTTIVPVKNLEVQTDVLYTKRKYKDISSQNSITYGRVFENAGILPPPYVRLADDQGNPLTVDLLNFSKIFRESAGNGLLLNWQYRPLAEQNASSDISHSEELLLNLNAAYKISPVFKASLKYKYQKTNGDLVNYNSLESYYARDYINYFTTYNATQITARPVPVGDMIRNEINSVNAQNLRGQIDANKTWNGVHEFNALAGAEVSQVGTFAFVPSRLYGYSKENLTYAQVNLFTAFSRLNGQDGTGQIFDGAGYDRTRTDRFISSFANVAYSYKKIYTLSASARTDGSNLFGVKENQKFQPLWSMGTAWNISNETFYKSTFLPYLKLRVTYGYTGNANNSTIALPSINYISQPNSINGQTFAAASTPPNDNLRWETTGQLNFGLDFGLKNNRLSGSVEYYDKKSKDLIALTLTDPTTGFTEYNVNSANIHGYGLDIALNSVNVQFGKWRWTSNALFSYNRNIVAKYLPSASTVNYLSFTAYGPVKRPAVGKDLYGLYAFKFAGLDPLTGDPIGYLNGLPSKAYSAINAPQSVDDLEYQGVVRPVYWGALRNTFSWGDLALSVNIQYKLGYKFQHPVTTYGVFLNGNGSIYDYSRRWTKPGDEKFTNVPSMVYPNVVARDNFYARSSASVEKADHIRLQDITLDYTFRKVSPYFKNLKIYANASNLGLLWRANKYGLDPDYGTASPPPLTLAFGLSANF